MPDVRRVLRDAEFEVKDSWGRAQAKINDLEERSLLTTLQIINLSHWREERRRIGRVLRGIRTVLNGDL